MTKKNFVLIGHDLGLANNIVNDIRKNYNITKDGIYVFLDIGAYKQGRFSEKICFITAGNKLTSLDINLHLLGGSNYSIDKWDKFTEYTR